jgi:Ca2+-binding EF-hand superfamily protein
MTTKYLPLILLLLAAGPALAAPDQEAANTGPRRNSGVMRYDINKDGFVDRGEWDQGQEARFRQLDTNNDGKLSKEELTANARNDRAAERQERFFNRMDRDRDGFVSKAEFMAQTDRNFARCDSDRDGRINAQECRQALRRQPADRANQQR